MEKVRVITDRYNQLAELTKPYLRALQLFPEKVKEFFDRILPPVQKEERHSVPEVTRKVKKKTRDEIPVS